MTELTPIIIALAALVSCVYGVIHGNLAALFNLLSPILALRSVDFSKLKADILALTPADRLKLEGLFDAALSIPDPAILQKIVGAASALDGAVTLAENVVTSAIRFYNEGAALVAQVKAIFGTVSGAKAPLPAGLTLPPWLKLPSWVPSWLLPTLISLLTNVVLPALEIALPAEAPLIQDLIVLLKGGAASPRLQAAWASAGQHYKATP